MRTAISAAVVAAVSAVAVLTPTAAFADSRKLDDRKGDTYKYVGEDPEGGYDFKKSGQTTNVDVDKVVVAHDRKRIKVTTTYFQMKKSGPSMQVVADLRDQDGTQHSLQWMAARVDGTWDFTGSVLPSGCGIGTGVTVDVRWKKDQVAVSAKRSCFGLPTWVTAHVDVLAFNDDQSNVYYDNPHTGKAKFAQIRTGKIKRG